MTGESFITLPKKFVGLHLFVNTFSNFFFTTCSKGTDDLSVVATYTRFAFQVSLMLAENCESLKSPLSGIRASPRASVCGGVSQDGRAGAGRWEGFGCHVGLTEAVSFQKSVCCVFWFGLGLVFLIVFSFLLFPPSRVALFYVLCVF